MNKHLMDCSTIYGIQYIAARLVDDVKSSFGHSGVGTDESRSVWVLCLEQAPTPGAVEQFAGIENETDRLRTALARCAPILTSESVLCKGPVIFLMVDMAMSSV